MLSWRQTARLAFGIVLIYWPIRLYVNTAPSELDVLADKLPFFVAEGSLTFLIFWGWIKLLDGLPGWLGLPNRLSFRREQPTETHLPTQLITLLIAVGLALLLNIVFGRLHRRMEASLEELSAESPLPDKTGSRMDMEGGQRRRLNNGLTVLALLSAFYLTASRRSSQQMQGMRVQAERLEKEAAQAQLAALRNQINPHFLFNSLSILSSLVEVNPKQSVQFINQLSKAYRYILEQRDAEQVTLRTELDFINSYTFLLRIRFDERLQVRITIPEADRDRYQIAPLTLQLLVENAVKHNQMSDEQPLIICIDREKDYLCVTNLLQPRPQLETSTSVGLTNIVNRYRLLSKLPVWIGETADEFVVKIPLLV